MNCLLVGGRGFIGHRLGLYLHQAGHGVVSLDRAFSPGADRLPQGVHQIQGVMSNGVLLKDAVCEYAVDCAVVLAGSLLPASTTQQLLANMDDEIGGMIHFVEQLQEAGIRRIVYFSSGGSVYGATNRAFCSEEDPATPVNSYGWLKLSIEAYVRMQAPHSGMQYLILRPSNVFGPGQRIHGRQGFVAVSMGRILQGQPLDLYGDGSTVRDFIYIDDLCLRVVRLMEQDQWDQTVNIGSGSGTSLAEMVDMLRSVVPMSVDIRQHPVRAQDVPRSVLSIERLHALIGAQPITPYSQALEETWKDACLQFQRQQTK